MGRGPLAGPVAIGMVVMEISEYEKLKGEETFPAGKDSKKLSPKKREFYLAKIDELKKSGRLRYGVWFEDNKVIDEQGIARAIRMATVKGFRQLACLPEETKVLLDGGLKAPKEFLDQESIIKGDEKELVIALASIAAKVSRDRLMVEMAKKYPAYGFEAHKGYGTASHIKALRERGRCEIHRKSFTRGLLTERRESSSI